MASRPRKKRNIVPLNVIRQNKRMKRQCGPSVTVERQLIYVGSSRSLPVPQADPDDMDLDTSKGNLESSLDADNHTCEPENESSHTKRAIQVSEKWSEVSEDVFRAAVEGEGIPTGSVCTNCIANACVRCTQCGPGGLFCVECALSLHTKWNHHHYLQLWKDDDSCFVYMDTQTPTLATHHCPCGTLREKLVTCFHIEGIPRKLRIGFCNCKSDVVTLVRLRYWPATPSRPSIAFSFELLDWLSALMLECQVPVHDFSNALTFIVTSKYCKMPCNVYPVLINAFEEYRSHQSRIERLCGDGEIVCPACPKEDGSCVTLSVDANFGLCRKKTAGRSVHGVRTMNKVFVNQQKVDSYVQGYAHKDNSKACHNFLAGHALRSKSRYSALDETGVMGVACKHEVPVPCFFNLKHGERIAYGVYMCEQLQKLYPNQKVNLMYDIACILVKHLKASGQFNLFSQFSFAVPVFHAYGHDSACQMEYNPRNICGFGLSDGEVVERLWSYLRRYSSMTKEMHPAHRVEVLSYALAYYSKLSASKLCKLLPKRLERTKKVKEEATQKLHDLLPDGVDIEDVPTWAIKEKDHLKSVQAPDEDIERQTLLCLAKERTFLLRLKTKYADGQSIAIRLSRRINVVTKQLKSKLEIFNLNRSESEKLSWGDITQLDSSAFPEPIKHSAVRLYHSIARANEEEHIILSEMRNTIKHYLDKLKALNAEICKMDAKVSRFETGKYSLLTRYRESIRETLGTFHIFAKHGHFPELDCLVTDTEESLSQQYAEETVSTHTWDSPSPQSEGIVSDHECESLPSSTYMNTTSENESESKGEVVSTQHKSSQSPSLPALSDGEVLVQPAVGDSTKSGGERQHSTDSDSDGGLEIQHWRKEMFLRDEYIHTQMKPPELNEEEKDLLHSVVHERDLADKQPSSNSTTSFLHKSSADLKTLCNEADRATKRLQAADKIAKGPYFTKSS